MLLDVKIHLEVMNVTASGDLLESTAKQVDTINIFLYIFLFSFFLFSCFCILSAGTLSGKLDYYLYKEKIRVVNDLVCKVCTSAVFTLVSKLIPIRFDFGSKRLAQNTCATLSPN